MPDRKQLIAALEGRIIGGEMHKGGYIHVPQEEAESILALLKEQEPVKAEYLNGAWWCTNCGNVISRVVDWSRRYCCHCGRKVKWE